MLDVLARADAARTKQEAIQAQLVDLDVRLRDTREAYDAARSRLNQRAADAYMFGPQEGIAMVLGASSAGDLADRVSFVDALQASDASLGRQTAASAERLDGLRGTKDTLLQAQEAQVATLASEQQDVATTFAAQQSALQALAGPRGELVALVSSLRTRMTQEEQAAANGAERGSSVTAFDAWSKLLLGHLGDPVCMNDRIVVVAWETAEFTKAAWNPLATTHDMPGATEFNSAGVKNYVSLEQGLEATIETLRGGAPSYRYGPILDGLASCGDPMSTALAVNASAWCNGCAGGRYVVDVVPAIEAYFAQHPS
jgi:hypothetical protein